MDAYYSYLKKYAVVADSEKLLLYWPKYVQYNVKFENELDFYAKLDSKNGWIFMLIIHLLVSDYMERMR